jgi:dual specificity protein kinase YAK1
MNRENKHFETHFTSSGAKRTCSPPSQPSHFEQPKKRVLSGPSSSQEIHFATQTTGPLRALTIDIVQTYKACNPQFLYSHSSNPKRVLTKPSEGVHNGGLDNVDYDFILYVGDWIIGPSKDSQYLVLDMLGQGTFGQVVKCRKQHTNEEVAIKIVKNKPAYFNQGLVEVQILEHLNKFFDTSSIYSVRLLDYFIHHRHLCMVFELLNINLYELLKQNQYRGLSLNMVRHFLQQILQGLKILREAKVIHCDLKPENILLENLSSPQIKLIDFGSACFEQQTVYTYIQSRFYRSPEVIIGSSYTAAIDMWSFGCIALELYLGLPIFPGNSEYNQLVRIIEMLGMLPDYMIEVFCWGMKGLGMKRIEGMGNEED